MYLPSRAQSREGGFGGRLCQQIRLCQRLLGETLAKSGTHLQCELEMDSSSSIGGTSSAHGSSSSHIFKKWHEISEMGNCRDTHSGGLGPHPLYRQVALLGGLCECTTKRTSNIPERLSARMGALNANKLASMSKSVVASRGMGGNTLVAHDELSVLGRSGGEGVYTGR
eukprot:CAMPEP_0194749168 /NCGR_PEP_ID=MMETSP0323_2-20130528/3364_1 /TAXON_ID=2866 ORGANISM="Crypthecodinium cohnii, Strain Seligo" /NCGR_SAMPLE_ID=MMETSP0323_2 /ASSEMBLY_ACC=CAM_ASM_000346 /LENGTH=168 /DNA_ID=CAMNT_0039664063 /DNA_START=61 /DNA_END=568 /DNA_ORIENTATION=-